MSSLAPSSGGVEITATGWRPQRELTFEEWAKAGRKLGQIARASQFWIGDWLNWGEAAYGEKYAPAVEVTGYAVGTLMDFAYVTNRFPPERRRAELTFSHHQEVAALEPKEADRWLDLAVDEGWSSRRLRGELRQERVRAAAIAARSGPAAKGTNGRSTRPPKASAEGATTEALARLVVEGEAAELGLRVVERAAA